MNVPQLVGLLLVAAAVCYVLAPIVASRAFGGAPGGAAVPPPTADDSLERRRDDLLAQLVELDFEHAVGKTDEEEYQQERAALKRRALAVLRSLDERDRVADAAEDAIEDAVRAARARRAAPPAADATDPALLALDDEVERQVSALRQVRRVGG